MDISVRRAAEDDFAAIADIDAVSFGVTYGEQELTDMRSVLDLDRFYVACDGDRVVGVTGDYPFTMTVPGGTIDVPGVTWVSVDPTYRRRGILRDLMGRQLSDYAEAGHPAAVLTASEGGIYGRFGYGPATHVRKTVIDRRRVSLPQPGNAGAVTRVSAAEARAKMPDIHDRWRASTPGALSRTDAWWDFLCLDRDWQRNGMTAMSYLLHQDGYIAYRIKSEWSDGDPRHLCWISEYTITTAEAHRDLWQVLLSIDLVASIQSYRIPTDDPIALLVNDSRQVRTTHLGDGMWVRPLDVAALLGSRIYGVEVDVVIEVVDDTPSTSPGGFAAGRYALAGGPDGAECAPTTRGADLALDAATLGSVFLGGVRLSPFARAGRVEVSDPSALARLDVALLADRAPVHGTAF